MRRQVGSARLSDSGKIALQVLVDRGSIEVFANNGRVAISHGVIPQAEDRSFKASVKGHSARISALDVYELRSAWK